jgi:hypothetical protein
MALACPRLRRRPESWRAKRLVPDQPLPNKRGFVCAEGVVSARVSGPSLMLSVAVTAFKSLDDFRVCEVAQGRLIKATRVAFLP